MGNKGCYGCLYFDAYDDDGYGFCDYHERWVRSLNTAGCGGYTYLSTYNKDNDNEEGE